ncbi:MAG TPA: transposase [Myxococcota bacterium]
MRFAVTRRATHAAMRGQTPIFHSRLARCDRMRSDRVRFLANRAAGAVALSAAGSPGDRCMPRRKRLDAPGLIHHVAARGVNRAAIFWDDADRSEFVRRLARLVTELEFTCFAWALIPNHFHLLVRREGPPLAKLMARLNGPFAQGCNRKHGRVGHLFQDRFVSRVVRDDSDLAALIKYVLFNPVRHRIVPPPRLAWYPWCAYGAIIGNRPPHAFEGVHAVAQALGGSLEAAQAYLRRELRSLRPEPPIEVRFDAIVRLEAERAGIDRENLGGRGALASRARERVAARAIHELGIPASRVAVELGVSQATVHRALKRRVPVSE